MSIPADVILDKEFEQCIGAFSWWLSEPHKGGFKYVRGRINKKYTYLHREIIGAKSGEIVDHINGNPLDNRRCNLRIVSTSENLQNRVRLQSNNTSGLRGVVWDQSRQKWQARVKLSGKGKLLGRFETKEEANAVVRDWRKKHMPFSEEIG